MPRITRNMKYQTKLIMWEKDIGTLPIPTLNQELIAKLF